MLTKASLLLVVATIVRALFVCNEMSVCAYAFALIVVPYFLLYYILHLYNTGTVGVVFNIY